MNNDDLLEKYCAIFNDTDDDELRTAVYYAVFNYLQFRVADMKLENMRIKAVMKDMGRAL